MSELNVYNKWLWEDATPQILWIPQWKELYMKNNPFYKDIRKAILSCTSKYFLLKMLCLTFQNVYPESSAGIIICESLASLDSTF